MTLMWNDILKYGEKCKISNRYTYNIVYEWHREGSNSLVNKATFGFNLC